MQILVTLLVVVAIAYAAPSPAGTEQLVPDLTLTAAESDPSNLNPAESKQFLLLKPWWWFWLG